MKLVKQRKGYDCVIAALAMITGESYEAVIANLDDLGKDCLAKEEGLFASTEINLLELLGFGFDYVDLKDVDKWEPDCNCALMVVPSKNKLGLTEGGKPFSHAIVYFKGKIYDPSPSNTYDCVNEACEKATWVNRIPFYQ